MRDTVVQQHDDRVGNLIEVEAEVQRIYRFEVH